MKLEYCHLRTCWIPLVQNQHQQEKSCSSVITGSWSCSTDLLQNVFEPQMKLFLWTGCCGERKPEPLTAVWHTEHLRNRSLGLSCFPACIQNSFCSSDLGWTVWCGDECANEMNVLTTRPLHQTSICQTTDAAVWRSGGSYADLSRDEAAEVGVDILHEGHVEQRKARLHSSQDVSVTSQWMVPPFWLSPGRRFKHTGENSHHYIITTIQSFTEEKH